MALRRLNKSRTLLAPHSFHKCRARSLPAQPSILQNKVLGNRNKLQDIFKVQDKFSIFKAYDIRGLYPSQINEKIVSQIVWALIKFFKGGRLIIAHDSRLSSPSLYKAVIQEFKKTDKFKLEKIGLSTTPMFYFLVNKFKASGGIMITASHNPKNYSGLKIVGRKAQMISGKTVSRIMKYE